ncbi:hypothetical protein AU252_00640 [Pseudarthrobacter sulfonivorans]|uniref:Putative glycogen debranching enzyme N-terminal domain-containing protein n=1 Tax=Pseudarthrobacter sulfonivorans TaxID=121292 RepID=A0A0U3Q6D6_9MICC|nr:hypothetical protein AU252_00640 [Pseudarthrobacter sulfonivorans]
MAGWMLTLPPGRWGPEPALVEGSSFCISSANGNIQPEHPHGVFFEDTRMVWHMHTTGEVYKDPGADCFTRQAPAKTKARAIGHLESLGYRVTLEPLQQTG